MNTQLEHILGLIESLETAVKCAMVDPSGPDDTEHELFERAAGWFIEHQTEMVSPELWGDFKKRVLEGE